jgi:hypothetical protein
VDQDTAKAVEIFPSAALFDIDVCFNYRCAHEAIVEAMPHPIPIRSLDDAAHTSPRDLRSFLKHDQNRTLLGFNYGPHDKDLMTYAVYAMSLQMDNLVNLDKVIQYGGIYYGFAPDGALCDSDKYFWVQAESLAAAALLGARTVETQYWDWYDRIWSYSWEHFVDHKYGAWFRILSRDNHRYSDEKSPAGKVDYHTMGACYEVLNVV